MPRIHWHFLPPLAFLFMLAFSACEQQELDYPTRPEITFKGIRYLDSLPPGLSPSDGGLDGTGKPHIEIQIEFKDAEGDLGYTEAERQQPDLEPVVFVDYFALIDDKFEPFIDPETGDEPLDVNDGTQRRFTGTTLDKLTPETNTKALKGTLRLYITWDARQDRPKGMQDRFFDKINYQYEVLFEVYLRDRAGNFSDTVRTTPVAVPRP